MEIRWRHIAYTHVLVCEYLHTGMTLQVKRCVKFCLFYREHASQYVASVISIFSDMVSYVKSCMLRRVRKLKSHEVVRRTSFRGRVWKVRWKIRCYVLNFTHRRVFISQKCARIRLVGGTFVRTHGGRDTTWEIKVPRYIQTRSPMWKHAHVHVLVSQYIYVEARLFTVKTSNSP